MNKNKNVFYNKSPIIINTKLIIKLFSFKQKLLLFSFELLSLSSSSSSAIILSIS